MRFSNISSLAAIVALAVMSFVTTSTASAEGSTQLCKVHTSLTCPKGEETTAVHMTLVAGTVGKLLSSLVNVLCLGVLVEATPLALGNPQEVHVLSSSYTGCGTGSAHSNCTVTVQEQPLVSLFKTGLDEGSVELLSGRTRLQCSNLGIDCVYDTEGTLFEVGGGRLKAENTPTTELGGKFFCPDQGQLDGELETLASSYILGEPEEVTALCKTHSSEKCAEKD